MKYKRLINDFIRGSLQMTEESNRIKINRKIYNQDEFDAIAEYTREPFSIKEIASRLWHYSFRKFISTIIPVIKWLPRYKWKKNILPDIICGLTVGVITIPQAMAYAMLARVPPVVGLYMAVFPVITYFLFSTSRHNSMGTFSIISLMVGEIVDHIVEVDGTAYSSIQIVATTSFLVAVIQLGLFVLRFGLIANILSDPLVNGFFCGAGVHVITWMLPSVLGLKARRSVTLFSVPRVLLYTVVHLADTNKSVLTMSLLSMFVMTIANEIIKPWIFHKLKIVLPVELITVITATAVTYYFDLQKKFDMEILEHVPAGLPAPILPVFVIIPKIVIKCLLIAIVSYSTSVSMGLIIAHKAKYRVRPHQELLAMSIANFVGSFFSCMPVASSLARTWVQYKTGGTSQIAGIVSALFIIIVLIFINPLFNYLPMCVLCSVVIVTLKGMLDLARQMPSYFKQNFWDGIVWLAAFVPTIVFNDTTGLFFAILMSAISLLIRANKPYTCVLGRLPGTEIYVDFDRYKGVEALYGIKIFHYCGSLNYAMRLYFKDLVYEAAVLKPTKALQSYVNPYRDPIRHFDMEIGMKHLRILILDFTALRYIDPSCVDLLHILTIEYEEINVDVYIAGSCRIVLETIKICGKQQKKKHTFIMFPTVHDAVTYAENKIKFMDLQDQP